MIGIFPDPYPDELLYSVLARLQDRLGFPSQRSVDRVVYGTIGVTSHIDLPHSLAYLVEELPPGHPYSVDTFIDDHTLLPFYAPFLPFQKLRQVREDMLGPSSKAHSRLGLSASRIRVMPFLRFCPLCVEAEHQQGHEPYWHRVHQIPGVEVCPTHGVWLEASAISTYLPTTFVSAQTTVTLKPPRFIDRDDFVQQTLLDIARDAAWLLGQPTKRDGDSSLLQHIQAALRDKGYLTRSSKVRVNALKRAFVDKYPAALLSTLQCDLDIQQHKPWLVRLAHVRPEVQQPIGYLLLCHFLGYSVEEVFRLPLSSPPPFGDGPWPCLNPVCAYYRQTVILTCSFHTPSQGLVQGLFACPHCGFAYQRGAPDARPEDQYRYTVVKRYGPLWEDHLKQLWVDPAHSLSAICQRLRLVKSALKRQALQLGLPFPRPGRTVRPPQAYASPRRLFREDEAILRERYRVVWLAARLDHPDWRRTQLMQVYAQAYTWLRRYDLNWLNSRLPPVQHHVGPTSRVNWAERDSQIATAIPAVAQRLKEVPRRPARVTRVSIARELHVGSLLIRSLHKLPKTKARLEQAVDTRVDYALRRIEWVVACYRQENVQPRTRYAFMHRASIRDCMQFPEVVVAFEEAFTSLQS